MKSKIIKVKYTSEFKGQHGITHYHHIELEDGSKGSIGSKTKLPDWMAEGKELEYELKGKNIKRVTKPFTPYVGAKKKATPSSSSEFPVGIDKMLFMDIETCGLVATFDKLDSGLKSAFVDKFDWWEKRFPEHEGDHSAMFFNRSALVAEYSKILTITFGYVKDGVPVINTVHKTKEARDLMDKFFDLGYYLVGHNIKGFDLPLLSKKCLSDGIRPPKFSPVYDQKPWELKVIDTNLYYKFGNNFTLSSIGLISAALGIESPKGGEVEGNNVHAFWYSSPNKKTLDKIVSYCEEDVRWLIKFMQYLNKLK